jgi:hypothetical protein
MRLNFLLLRESKVLKYKQRLIPNGIVEGKMISFIRDCVSIVMIEVKIDGGIPHESVKPADTRNHFPVTKVCLQSTNSGWRHVKSFAPSIFGILYTFLSVLSGERVLNMKLIGTIGGNVTG